MPEPDSKRKRPSIRFVFWSVLLVGSAAAGIYLADRIVLEPRRELLRRIEAADEQIARLRSENERLETYLRLLRYSERRARIEVLDQSRNQEDELTTRIRFTEVDPTGTPVAAAREFTLVGQEVYIDTLTIRFEDHFVEAGDPLKGRALMLFRRIFTSRMKPEEGYVLDRDGQAPEIYASEQAPTEFERGLWRRFWELAGDETLARRAGVRAIHGDAPYTRLEPNRIYHVVLRSTGEVSITPARIVTGR